MNYSDPNQAERALRDPTTAGETLAAIAQVHPGLRDRVAAHPNAYPQLVAWVAAQRPPAATAAERQPSADPAYGQAPQPYGPAQPAVPARSAFDLPQPAGPAQPDHGLPQPSGLGQPYYAPGGYPAGPPAKKKTGLVVGLVGGGVVALAVVAVLGVFVFHWFGGSSGSGSGPILTKSQVEAFLDSDFMASVSDDHGADAYAHRNQGGVLNVPDGCEAAYEVMKTNTDQWTLSSPTVRVNRYSEAISMDDLMDGSATCEWFDPELVEGVSVVEQDGGWRSELDGTAWFLYGNVEVQLSGFDDTTDAELSALFDDYVAAVAAAAR